MGILKCPLLRLPPTGHYRYLYCVAPLAPPTSTGHDKSLGRPSLIFWVFFKKKNSRLNPWMSFDLFGETALRISKWSAKKVIGGAENVAAAEYDSGSRDSRRGENGRNDRIK